MKPDLRKTFSPPSVKYRLTTAQSRRSFPPLYLFSPLSRNFEISFPVNFVPPTLPCTECFIFFLRGSTPKFRRAIHFVPFLPAFITILQDSYDVAPSLLTQSCFYYLPVLKLSTDFAGPYLDLLNYVPIPFSLFQPCQSHRRPHGAVCSPSPTLFSLGEESFVSPPLLKCDCYRSSFMGPFPPFQVP